MGRKGVKVMYINPNIEAGIMPLYPSGTNSTMFTECCGVAILKIYMRGIYTDGN